MKRKISEERILQISNDISEEMRDNLRATTKTELIEVVKYFRDAFDAERRKSCRISSQLMLFATSLLENPKV